MTRGDRRLFKVSLEPAIPHPSMPYGRATPETDFWPFQGWFACRVGALQPSSILLDTTLAHAVCLCLIIVHHSIWCMIWSNEWNDGLSGKRNSWKFMVNKFQLELIIVCASFAKSHDFPEFLRLMHNWLGSFDHYRITKHRNKDTWRWKQRYVKMKSGKNDVKKCHFLQYGLARVGFPGKSTLRFHPSPSTLKVSTPCRSGCGHRQGGYIL
jgi:hypothetical protein